MAKQYLQKLPGILAVLLVLPCRLRAADQFGDISVEANAIYTGNTYHGYAERRVVLENKSPVHAHEVTLIYPNNPFGGYGNSISRMSRSVKLDPGAREMVSLLQPPLPSQGDGAIRVEVDGRHEGEVHAPNVGGHCNLYSGRGQSSTVFISRSLDYDAVERVFHANSGAFTAAKAVGPPDTTAYGNPFNSWMPDTRAYGKTNWLELDYATPQTVNQVAVCRPRPSSMTGSLVLLGASGTNLAKISLSSGRNFRSGSTWETDYSLPPTREPVKTVRLDFGKTPPYNLTVDAVQISGPTGSQWASDARASSDNSASAAMYSPGSAMANVVESLRAESPVSEWSADWLAYTPFDAVVLSASDMTALSPSVFAALGDYLNAGGNLVLLGHPDLPAAWHPVQQKRLADGTEYGVGFGDCFALATENASNLESQTVGVLRSEVLDTARYWQGLPGDAGAANSMLPVVENLRIPTRGITLMMLAFIVVIGPVNMIYLARINRRTWMLWTIPAISLLTTLLVFAYSLVREGITPDTRIAGVTLLDQASHFAATIGGEAFYCPLTPSGGLHFDYGTEVTPLVPSGFDRSGTPRDVDWSQSQHLAHGWVSARVPAQFHVREAGTRRERIQLIRENGRLKVVNSLGAPIKTIWVADRDSKIYQAENVDAGQMAGLILSPVSDPADPAGKFAAAALLHDLTYAAHTDALGANVGRYLLPGTYIAELNGNPFLENGLGRASSPQRTRASAVVYGILDSPDPQ